MVHSLHTSRKNAKCSFNTFLNDDANDAIYENDGHSSFKKQAAMNLSQNVCISKKAWCLSHSYRIISMHKHHI